MTVHVRRNGKWIDAPCYEVGDEISMTGNEGNAVVTKVWVGDDGVPSISLCMALQQPIDSIPLKFELNLATEIEKARCIALINERCPECGLAPEKVDMIPVEGSVPPVKVLECLCNWGHRWNVKAKWSREKGAPTACYPTREGDGQ